MAKKNTSTIDSTDGSETVISTEGPTNLETNPESSSEIVPTTDTSSNPETKDVAVLEAGSPESGLVKEPVVEIVEQSQTLGHLVEQLPHLKRLLIRFKRTTPEELDEALTSLDPVKRRSFQDVLDRMNPLKPGVHLARKQTLTTLDVKIYQGTGNDDSRPQLCPPGGIYSRDGRILAVPKEFAAHTKAPTSMRATVINIYEGRNFWPPRENKEGTIPPGIHPHEDIPFDMITGKPYCRSLDRVRGETFGDCASCRYRPFRETGTRECTNDMHLFLVLEGFTGLYRFILSGTSVGSAGQSVINKIRNWPFPWYRQFEFETEVKTEKKLRWFALKAKVATSPDSPEGIAPPGAEALLYSLLSAQVDAEIYFPQLAFIYKQSTAATSTQKEGEATVTSSSGHADLDAQIAAAEAAKPSALPADYSQNNL